MTVTRESVRWVAAAGLALSCLAANLLLGVSGAAARECTLKLVGSADISTPRDWIVLMNVTVNGHPAGMELDMASIASIIRSSYVQSFGLRLRPARVHMEWRSETDTTTMTQFARLPARWLGEV